MGKYPEFAFTGPTPATGYVGFVNIRETDAGVEFTVRSQGGDGTALAFEMGIGDAIQLLDQALSNFANRE